MIKEVGIQVLAIVQSIVGLEYLLSISSTGDHERFRRQRSKRESVLVFGHRGIEDMRFGGMNLYLVPFQRGLENRWCQHGRHVDCLSRYDRCAYISIVVVMLLILLSPFQPVYMFSSKCGHLPRAGSTLLAHCYHSSQVSFVWLQDHFYKTAGIVPLLINPLTVFTNLPVQQLTTSSPRLIMNATLYARLQHGVGHIWILLGQP